MGKLDINDWIKKLPVNKKKSKTNAPQIGLEMTPNAISAVQLTPQKDRPTLNFNQLFYGTDVAERIRCLKEFIEPQLPKKYQCNMVLHPSYYRLLLVDAPDLPDDAPPDELKETMKWRIKDLISEPIDKVVLDIISLPKDAYEGRMNMVYVAVAPIQQIDAFLEGLNNFGLAPNSIDIPEMTASTLCLKIDDSRPFACIGIREQGSFVNVITESQLYLTRNVDISLDTLHSIADGEEHASEQLLSEVQRSMDYYESQLGKGQIEQIIFLPAASRGCHATLELLTENLDPPVFGMDLSQIIEAETELSVPEQAHALPAIGAAMRGL